MNALTLQWQDAGQNKTQNIYEQQPSKNPGTVRIGRDPRQCDIVVTNPTVSGLHVEIFFHSQQQRFYIRNLRSPNPPLVDGKQLVQGEMPLTEGSMIYLGQMKLYVTTVIINSIPATILAPLPLPVAQPKPQANLGHHHHQQSSPTHPRGVYGLECPRCHKVSPAENLQVGCPWCGTSLAAAVSVLVAPSN
ncbi:FHA domain-containing protein [Cylindrospermum sp. FACHB-282]|uniref:FHA domain-containing protein n=1 Tax=Cylindrospermum sp. FACHB-282 TaxID=2692794 RepID=UPI001689BF3F|nr:FHA domain-containing protein [Cylindrospermum sp. FACHB-282]MBD2387571.1 FHA domain-containing protein [Cylindrospermum sp. FACHB-282]